MSKTNLQYELKSAFDELQNGGDTNIIARRVADATEKYLKSATITDGDGKPCHVY